VKVSRRLPREIAGGHAAHAINTSRAWRGGAPVTNTGRACGRIGSSGGFVVSKAVGAPALRLSLGRPAILALADGTTFHGYSIGADGAAVGEVVFNTAITGYQEILTDPSYARQIVTLTHPHVGNTGINEEDMESTRVWAPGFVVRDVPRRVSNWRSQKDLPTFLREQGVVGIAGVDTRALTRVLREKGAQGGCVLAGDAPDAEEAIAQARAFPGLAGMDLAQHVTVKANYAFTSSTWRRDIGHPERVGGKHHVVAFDFGVKRNILRMLVARDCRLTVVPAQTTYDEVMALAPDGVFLSNGPGDPEPCDYAIRAISQLLADAPALPIFGICLGHQLLALASGARTLKMSHGHHGANHPVKDIEQDRVIITSQNHGFAVDGDSLPACLKGTHVSLFDGSLQGIRRTDRPAFSFQGHPEASPGPHDCAYLFDDFVAAMAARSKP
jgi:carbamoyl-phosphate synthase small subunit